MAPRHRSRCDSGAAATRAASTVRGAGVDRAFEPARALPPHPFCSAVCPYCDFAVMRAAEATRKRFVDHLIAEVPLAARAWPDPRPFDTVYFGGGTPSLLPPEDLARVLDACREHLALASPAPWVFLEANPEDVTPDACAAWRRLGVRTLSLGVQSFCRRRPPLPRPPPHRQPGAGRRRGRPRRGLRHRLGRPHLRPARPDPGGLAARARDGRGAVTGAPVVLPAHHPPRARRFGVRAARGELAELPDGDQAELFDLTHRFLARRGLARLRGLQLRAQPRPRVAPQPQVLGPHALPRARPVGTLVRGRRRVRSPRWRTTPGSGGRPPLVERAAHPAVGAARGGGRAAGRGRGAPRARGRWPPRR